MKIAELDRVRDAYRRRIETDAIQRYSLFRRGELFMQQDREDAVLQLLKEAEVTSLTGRKILEIGCGRGDKLANFQRWGATPAGLYGIDLMLEFAKEARHLFPAYSFACASADKLPFPDAAFDIVTQFTVFTSVLDSQLQELIAREMRRVLAPGGVILWYDFRMPNPYNRDVRPVSAAVLRRLFPACDIDIRSVTLLPPLARAIAPVSILACRVLLLLPFLRSHYVAAIRPEPIPKM